MYMNGMRQVYLYVWTEMVMMRGVVVMISDAVVVISDD